MQIHRIETKVLPNGRIVLENLPFGEGESVEIIVSETKEKLKTEQKPLFGTLLKYEEPFAPTSVEDWEVLK